MQRVCRTCMSPNNLCPLFPKVDNYRSYVRALYLSTGLQIVANDGLTQEICKTCAKTIENVIHFRCQSQATEKRLLKMAVCQNRQRISQQSHRSINVREEPQKELGKQKLASNEYAPKTYITIERGKIKNDVVKLEYETENITDNKDNTDCDESDSQDNSFPCLTNEEERLLLSSLKTPMTQPKPYADLKEDLENEEIQCKICKKVYKTMPAFEKHARTHMGFGIICEFCGRHCLSNAQLLRHLRALHGLARDNSYACSYCEYQALDKEQLESHERRTHTKERPYVCDQCGEAFYTKRVLIQHGYTHRSEKPFECNLCSSKFKVLSRLNHHKRVVHHKKFSCVYGCYLCSKTYNDSTSTRKHLAKYHGVPKEKQGKVLRISRDQGIS